MFVCLCISGGEKFHVMVQHLAVSVMLQKFQAGSVGVRGYIVCIIIYIDGNVLLATFMWLVKETALNVQMLSFR